MKEVGFDSKKGRVHYFPSKTEPSHIARFHYHIYFSFSLPELVEICKFAGGTVTNEKGEIVFKSNKPFSKRRMDEYISNKFESRNK